MIDAPDTPEHWTRTQLWAAIVVSGFCSVIVAAKWIWPDVFILDSATLGLLALAVLPWLTLFVKKFKISGVGEMETQDRAQGTTRTPLPPADVQPAAIATPAATREDTKKVLATLWRYQRQHFGDDVSKRWTFAVLPIAKDYSRYLAGLSEAISRGWVAVNPETHQCMLTNEGLAYVANEPALHQYADIYWF